MARTPPAAVFRCGCSLVSKIPRSCAGFSTTWVCGTRSNAPHLPSLRRRSLSAAASCRGWPRIPTPMTRWVGLLTNQPRMGVGAAADRRRRLPIYRRRSLQAVAISRMNRWIDLECSGFHAWCGHISGTFHPVRALVRPQQAWKSFLVVHSMPDALLVDGRSLHPCCNRRISSLPPVILEPIIVS